MTGPKQWIVAITAVCAVMTAPAGAAAQQGPALIREGIGAYNDFDPQRALPLLRRGVDPKAGPRDSLWALGVQYLAQILYEQGDEGGARAWIRWAVRFGTELKLDTLNLLSPVIAEFHSARATTPAGPEDARVRTEWVWPSTDPGSGPGRIEVPSDGTPASLTATVTGRGVLSPRLSLPAGSYEIEARASGYRPAKITREVLPGITTVLVFALEAEAPVGGLSPAIRGRVAARVAPLLVTRFGLPEPECGDGAVVGGALLLTTYRAIRGAERITLRGNAVADAGPTVAAYDVSRDLAVLKLPSARADSLTVSPALAEGQNAWGFGLGSCRVPGDAPIAVSWADRQHGVLRLKGSVPGAVPGGVLVAADGALVAVVTADTTAVAVAGASDLLARARANIAAHSVRSPVEVAGAERHRYGAIKLTAPAYAGATAQVTPPEAWHWPELAKNSALPLTFAGPEGRYRLVVTTAGTVRYDSTFALVAGVTEQLAVPARQPIAATKKGHFPWAIAVLGAVGAGVAAAVLGGKGGGGGGGGGTPPSTGGITINIPNP